MAGKTKNGDKTVVLPKGAQLVDTATAMNIQERITAITIACGAIEKTEKAADKAGGFAFMSIDKMVDTLKPLLDEYGVFYYQKEVEPGRNMNRFEMASIWRIQCTDKPDDFLDIPSFGDGTHGRDLAPNIAQSFALRNFLRIMFRLATGGTEEYSSEQHKTADEHDTEGAARADAMGWLKKIKIYNGVSDDNFRSLMRKRYKKSSASMSLDEILHVVYEESKRAEYQPGIDYVNAMLCLSERKEEEE